jgi:hypothetical protein
MNLFFSLAFALLSTTSFAQVNNVPALNGLLVSSFDSVSPFNFNPGVISDCIQSKNNKSKRQLIIYKCKIDGGSFVLNNDSKSSLTMPIHKLVYIETDETEPEDFRRSYHFFGTWPLKVGNINLNSESIVVINAQNNGNFRGHVKNEEFNLSKQLFISQ